ncbi:MAG: DUF2147 domain-containing protein [Candidatus Cloacimonetes bacterium]|nr:DUF2147 domain-containing protein [Candidatus Cloacimonadota bacterium]
MKKAIIIILILMVVLPIVLFAQKASTGDKILGVWYNGEKTSKIEVYKTTKGDYAGRIIWLKVPNDSKGKPRTDIENPKAEHRSRALLNLNVMHSLAFQESGKYAGGTIYDPKNGKTYSCKAELVGDNTLNFRGFIGVSLIGRTTTWVRTTK